MIQELTKIIKEVHSMNKNEIECEIETLHNLIEMAIGLNFMGAMKAHLLANRLQEFINSENTERVTNPASHG